MKSRIRIAVSARVIVATIRKRTGTGESLHAIPRIPDPTVFGKTPLNQPPDTSVPHIQPDGPDKRLNLFGYQWDTTVISLFFWYAMTISDSGTICRKFKQGPRSI